MIVAISLRRVLRILALGLIAFSTSLPADVRGSTFSCVDGVNTSTGTSFSVCDPSGEVSHNFPPLIQQFAAGPVTATQLSGFANAGGIGRAYGVARSADVAPGALEMSVITARFANEISVGSTGGLSAGAPVQLEFSLRVGGRVGGRDLRTSIGAGDSRFSLSTVDFIADFLVLDPDNIVSDGEESGPDRLVEFDLSGIRRASGFDESSFSSEGESIQRQWSWDITSNAGGFFQDSENFFLECFVDAVCGIGGTGSSAFNSFNLDTGLLVVTANTAVGHHLEISGFVNVLAQASGGLAFAEGDFLNSLGFEVRPITDGVTLDFAIPALVPEPSATALLAAGLSAIGVLLAGSSRRPRLRDGSAGCR